MAEDKKQLKSKKPIKVEHKTILDVPVVDSKKGTSKPVETPKTRKGRTHLGGKSVDIKFHPKPKRMDHRGNILENTCALVYGQMNPPTIGHERIVAEAAKYGQPVVILSPTNNLKNPLTDVDKLALVQEAFGDMAEVSNMMSSNPIKVLQHLAEQYDHLVWICGSDREGDYRRIAESYNGKDFTFNSISVVSLIRDETGGIQESISSTMLRQAVDNKNTEFFAEGLATKLKPKAEQVYEMVETGMNMHRKNSSSLINEVRDSFGKRNK